MRVTKDQRLNKEVMGFYLYYKNYCGYSIGIVWDGSTDIGYEPHCGLIFSTKLQKIGNEINFYVSNMLFHHVINITL